jgi:hypothetical protein
MTEVFVITFSSLVSAEPPLIAIGSEGKILVRMSEATARQVSADLVRALRMLDAKKRAA